MNQEQPKVLTAGEKKTFAKNCNELIEYVRLYGLPSSESCFVIEIMMAARLRSIRQRPELLSEAKKLDKKGIIFN